MFQKIWLRCKSSRFFHQMKHKFYLPKQNNCKHFEDYSMNYNKKAIKINLHMSIEPFEIDSKHKFESRVQLSQANFHLSSVQFSFFQLISFILNTSDILGWWILMMLPTVLILSAYTAYHKTFWSPFSIKTILVNRGADFDFLHCKKGKRPLGISTKFNSLRIRLPHTHKLYRSHWITCVCINEGRNIKTLRMVLQVKHPVQTIENEFG